MTPGAESCLRVFVGHEREKRTGSRTRLQPFQTNAQQHIFSNKGFKNSDNCQMYECIRGICHSNNHTG